MKNFVLKYTGIFMLLLFSCSKDFIDTEPTGSLTVDAYFQYPEDFRLLSRSMYGRDWFNYLDKASTCVGELLTGNGYTYDGVYLAFFNGTITGDFEQLAYTWSTYYGIITRANQAISSIYGLSLEEGGEMDQARNITIGECRFFRAYSYFHLVSYWGPVPVVIDNAAEYTDINKPRIVKEDVYELVIRDLNDAIERLPEITSQPYLSKFSARALLAKVYLSRASEEFGSEDDFTKARDLASYIIENAASAGYQLMDNYHDLWLLANNNNAETLFAWQWGYTAAWADYGIQNTLQSYYAPSEFTGSWDGWSSVVPSVDFINSWEEGDLRRYSTMMEEGNYYPEFWIETGGYTYNAYTCNYGGPTRTLTSIRKHLAGKDNSSDGHIAEMHTECYTPMIRLADLYLTYAEAVLGKNSSTTDEDALEYFNTIRRRAGLDDKSSITLADIYNERRHEFAFEFVNWDDLLRYYRVNPQEVTNLLLNQERGYYHVAEDNSLTLESWKLSSVTSGYFELPIPSGETLIDPLLLESPVQYDFSNYY